MNILKREFSQELIKIIPPFHKTSFDEKKPYYRYNWELKGWEEVYIWNSNTLNNHGYNFP